MIKNTLIAILIFILIGCTINVEDSTRTISSSHYAEGVKGLKISNNISFEGDITINGDLISDTIHLAAEVSQMVLRNEAPADVNIYLKDIDNGNKKVAFKTESGDWQGITIGNIRGKVPSLTSLDLSSSFGDIDVKSMEGSVFADASCGDVNITSTGVVDVDNSSGNVTIKSNDDCRVDASSGDVYVNTSGFIKVDVSSGDAELYTLEGCKVESSSGKVQVTVTNDTTIFQSINIETSSGDVKVSLPADFVGWLDLKSSSGDINLKNSQTEDSFYGAINGGQVGDRVIKVRCSSGDITVNGY